jgi:hypothetical protein
MPESDNPRAIYQLRTEADSKAFTLDYINARRGQKKITGANMKAVSLNGQLSAFWDANCGTAEGLHSATPADRTHHLFLGLVKTCTKRLFDKIAEYWQKEKDNGRAGPNAVNDALDEIDRRFAAIPRFTHGSERRYRNFPSGISDLTLLQAKDYASIVQFWPYVFGHGTRYVLIPATTTTRVCVCECVCVVVTL